MRCKETDGERLEYLVLKFIWPKESWVIVKRPCRHRKLSKTPTSTKWCAVEKYTMWRNINVRYISIDLCMGKIPWRWCAYLCVSLDFQYFIGNNNNKVQRSFFVRFSSLPSCLNQPSKMSYGIIENINRETLQCTSAFFWISHSSLSFVSHFRWYELHDSTNEIDLFQMARHSDESLQLIIVRL